jgi:FkbM family methyltransferase
MSNKPFLRFKWNHRAKLHRDLIKFYNSIMRYIPFSVKYSIGKNLRSNQPPYSLVPNLSTVIQVGAPKDTLEAGRSRGMYFCIFAQSKCRVIIIEPDPENISKFRLNIQHQSLHNVTLIQNAAWSKNTDLKLYADSRHPATNFISGCTSYNDDRMRDFREINVSAKTIDSILADLGLKQVDLISITTNGAEWEIIAGMVNTIDMGLKYICIATGQPDDHLLHQKMNQLGYSLYAYDDRGCTFSRKE